MTYRIQVRLANGAPVIAISGEIAAGYERELRAALDAEVGPHSRLDLGGLRVVDVGGVRLLAAYEARGVTLTNCPGYVRTWIDKERQEDGMTTMDVGVAREATIAGADGVQLFYRTWQPANTPRAVMVVVPGFNSHSGYYGWVAQQLTAIGVSVYALDLRGRGRSEGERFYVEEFADYLSDIDRIVHVAQAEHSGLPVFLLGHSAGGVMASLYALDHQAQLAGLVSEGIAFKTPAPDFALAVLKGLSHVIPHAHVLKLKNEDFSRDPAVVESMNSDPLIADETQPTQTVAALVRADERLASAFPQITLPVLLLHGTADKAAKSSGSQQFYDNAGSPDKTLKFYDDAYHDLLNDSDKQVVMNDIVGWLTARLPGRSE